MKLTTIFLTTLISAGVLGCDGDQGPPGPAGPPGPSGSLDPDTPAIEKAFTGLGGREAVATLASFRIRATGERLVTLEGFIPDDDSELSSTFAADVTADVAGDRLRIAYQRKIPLFGAMTDYRVIVKGNVGVIDGVESVFGTPGGAMPSDRWAATVRQHRLLNPQLLLRDVALGKATATDAGLALRDGELRHQIDITSEVRTISLFVDRRTGEITELATLENDFVAGDVKLEVHYASWQKSDGGDVRFPSEVVLAIDDQIWHAEHRASVTTQLALDDAQFAFPAGAAPSYVAADAARGARTAEFHEVFASIGVPLDGLQTAVDAQQLAPGVWHLRGGSHNSLVVEQAAGVVIVEAPLYEARAQAIYAWVAANLPGKPVTHVIATHHHRDHAGGLRTFAARGAKLVIGEAARPLFSRTVRAAHTIEPDELTAAPRTATFVTVPAGGELTLGDATRPVRVIAVDSTHAADMVVAYTPNQRVLFVSDLFSPGLPLNPAAAREVRDAVQARGLAIDAIAGGHGGVGTREDLDTAAGS